MAAFLSGYIGLSVAAIVTSIEFGIKPLIAHGADGRPLYAPYPLSIAVPVMALEHLFLFGIIEGIITFLLLRYFLKYDSDQIYSLPGKEV